VADQQNRVTAPDGTVHTFPAGTTPEQMAEALGLSGAAPEPSHAKPPQGSAALRFIGGVASGLNPINMARGVYQTVRHPIDTLVTPTVERGKQIMPALREGRYTDAANAAAGAIPLLGPAADALSTQSKSGDTAGALGGITALIAGPKIIKGAGKGVKAAATDAAGLVLKADRGTRTAALEHSAMPGLLKSGLHRTERRLSPVAERVREVMAGPEGSRRTLAVSSPRTMQDVTRRPNAAPHQQAAQAVEESMRAHPALQPHPTARAYAELGEGGLSRTRGAAGSAEQMERSLSRMMLDESARVSPSARADIGSLSALEGVADAYARSTQSGVAPGMAPTLSARLAIAATNRLIGPTAQNVYRTGGLMESASPAALRALMLQELMTRSGSER
jgi:hypothetical protein